MTLRLHISIYLIVLAIVLSIAPLSHAASYTFTTVDVPGATYTRAVAINNYGNIVGYYYYDTSTETHGFFLDHAGGAFTPIDYPGATFTQARGINDAGNIVGVYSDGTKLRGFFLDHVGGTFTLIDYPGTEIVVYSINNSGNIVGSYTAGGVLGEHGYYLTAVGGSFTTIDIPNALFTTAVGINDSGNITGNYRDATGTHGYFLNYVGGVFTPIDYPSTAFTFTDGINNIGNIVGSYQAAGIRHGYFLDAVGGNYTPLDFPGAIDTPHLGINDAGSIVGIYSDTSGIFHGFLSTKNVFSGFFSPVDNLPIVNNAKAGQTIPIIWRITDANGAPISDPASFKNLTSSQIGCDSLSVDPISVIEEYSAGNLGLQYSGDGYWQFNWKTLKTYAGQCRKMLLTLGDGSKHVADFKFK